MTKHGTSNKVEGNDRIQIVGKELMLRANGGGIKLIFWTDSYTLGFSGTIFSRI